MQYKISIPTQGRGFYNITAEIADCVQQAGLSQGLCNVFIQHTSASLIITENADPQVRDDLESFMQRLVPDGDSLFRHTAEGPDDMPAHVRSVLTETSCNIPVANNRLCLGTWQGLFLWEHRLQRHKRNLIVSLTAIA